MAAKLGLIAGTGSLPAQLIERCRQTGRPLFVLGIIGQTDPALLEGTEHGWVRLGAAEAGIQLLRAAGVVDLVMVGGIRRPSLAELKPDLRVAKLFARAGLRALGDDRLLRLVRDELEGEGFRLIGVDQILDQVTSAARLYGTHRPDAQAEADIELGFRVLDAIGHLDIGQAVIVQQGMILGLEAIEGTDALIDRCGALRRDGPGGVLVKAAKRVQETRFDLPTVGPGTIERASSAGLRGLAFEAGRSLVVDQQRMIELADRLGLFVLGVDRGERPPANAPLIYLIAGEPSGDLLGARLMAALVSLTGGAVTFAGIGGEQMMAAGLKSLLPIKGLAIMGVVEVLPSALRILRWVRQTAADIERLKPAAVVTIDSSGFCFRVADRLRRKPHVPPIIHYVAPMVWAWRSNRVRNAVRAADHLLTLLPFEPDYFVPRGLPSTFVGHPAVENALVAPDAARFRAKYQLPEGAPLLCVLPGSRGSEVKRLLPVFREAVRLLAREIGGLQTVIPTVETVSETVRAQTADWPTRLVLTRTVGDKIDAFAASTAAMAASGTVSLELAVAGVPMVVGYRFWPITAWVLRRAIKVRFSSLVNILLDREVIPELMQEACTPEQLVRELLPLLTSETTRDQQRAGFAEALGRLKAGEDLPSVNAARRVLDLIRARTREGVSPDP